MNDRLDLVILGLSVTSSWGNGHATTYRALIRHLHARGHNVLFLERDVPWYSANRDMPVPECGRVELYGSTADLVERFEGTVRRADAVIVGSYVPDGIAVGDWVLGTACGVTAFYDIDTPITLSHLNGGGCEYLEASQIPRYDLYLSFTGGPVLTRLEAEYGSPMARALYCSADSHKYYPEAVATRWLLGYMGTYSIDRQPKVDRLLLAPASVRADDRFVVAGSAFPVAIDWPINVERIEHVPPELHRRFYNQQGFTLNVTRADMVLAGYAPSVRLFEAAACGVAIISDYWEGLENFFEPGVDILIASESEDTLRYLERLSDAERRTIGRRGRERVLAGHTGYHRAEQLDRYLRQVNRKQKSMAS